MSRYKGWPKNPRRGVHRYDSDVDYYDQDIEDDVETNRLSDTD